jgi:putative effector of murein hydrolase
MPEPQAGTPTVVATDVDSGIRLGIGSHSVGTAQTPVKSGRAQQSASYLAASTPKITLGRMPM